MIPRLHVVTDRALVEDGGFVARAREVLAAGGPELALHVRAPGAGGGRVYRVVEALLLAAGATGARVYVNDRADVAAAAGAHGVHLPERSLPVGAARALVGPDAALGASVHGAARSRQAEADGADYLVVGTLFATPSHPERAPAGPGRVAEVAAATGLPLVGIGGVTAGRVSAVVEAGAHGVAVLGAVWGADDPSAAVRGLLEALAAAGPRKAGPRKGAGAGAAAAGGAP